MNGIHDMGGIHGMGPIQAERNEPVFHAAWEARAFALSMAVDGDWTIGADRHQIELIPPAEYLRKSYYEKWVTSLVELMAKTGMVAWAEIESGKAMEATSKVGHALTAAEVPAMIASGAPASRNVPAAPHFRAGQRVRAVICIPWGIRACRATREEKSGRSSGTTVYLFFRTPALTVSGRSRSMCTRCALPRASCGASRPADTILYTLICGTTILSQHDPTRDLENLDALHWVPRQGDRA